MEARRKANLRNYCIIFTLLVVMAGSIIVWASVVYSSLYPSPEESFTVMRWIKMIFSFIILSIIVYLSARKLCKHLDYCYENNQI